jgi:type I restriction enzyme R subunit
VKKHTEARLEDAIIDHLTAQGGYVFVDYREGAAKNRYDKALALDPALVVGFIQTTQEKMWKSLAAIHGEETPKVVVDYLAKELETKGMLKVLRQGFKCYGKLLRVAVFAPNNRMNPDTLALYGQNVLSVTRQLYYGAEHSKSLDLVLFLNGLPIATAELKNPLSGQTVEDAKKQYKRDRDHREPIFDFTKRALVHFAVDQEEVFMATRLSGEKTHFLPFNLGNEGHAGNPPAADGGYRTAYLWREVWQRDSLLDILGRFMHLHIEEKRILTDEGIKKITKETMIFPR